MSYQALEAWFELSKANLYRNDLKWRETWQATVQIEWSIAHGQLFPLSSFCSTQISKYCFLRLPELSQLLFCIWNRRPRVFGSVSHFNSFHDDNGTILSSLLYKPANVDYLRRWPHETSTIVIIRFCIHSWQRNPFLDRSHRCQCLANFGHRGRSDLSGEIVSILFWTTLFSGRTSWAPLCCSDGPTVIR